MYKSRRRPWVKLYCREWLTSTVRFDLTESDRSRFIDLLALAGDSKIPGVVCAGHVTDDRSPLKGYPIDWLASTMRCEVPALETTLKTLESQDRISLDGNPKAPIIYISGWKKYQSEYLRQIRYIQPTILQSSAHLSRRTPGSSLHLCSLEVEGEVEREAEVEGEKEPTLLHLKNNEVKSPHKKFQPPTEDEVASYMAEQGFKNPADRARDFINYYETLGWVPKGSKVQMKSWKAAVRTWKSRERSSGETEDPEHERIMLEIEQEAQRRAAQRIQQRNVPT